MLPVLLHAKGKVLDTRTFDCGETGGIFIPVVCDEDAAHEQ